jgi:hypothetical protein
VQGYSRESAIAAKRHATADIATGVGRSTSYRLA